MEISKFKAVRLKIQRKSVYPFTSKWIDTEDTAYYQDQDLAVKVLKNLESQFTEYNFRIIVFPVEVVTTIVGEFSPLEF